MSKKDKAFELFNDGKTPTSPEVKDLKLKGSTRYNYFYEWQRSTGSATTPKATTGKVISELEMLVPATAGKEEEGEVKPEEGEPNTPEPFDDTLEPPDDTPEPPVKPEDKPGAKPGKDGPKPLPTMVAGQSLTFAISISVKTLMLYQIAASMQEGELTLGDFVDACVEDTYIVRGFDVGLIKTGGE